MIANKEPTTFCNTTASFPRCITINPDPSATYLCQDSTTYLCQELVLNPRSQEILKKQEAEEKQKEKQKPKEKWYNFYRKTHKKRNFY